MAAPRRHHAVMGGWRRALYDHWFAPAPLADLALVRSVVAAMQLALLLVPALASDVGICIGCDPALHHWLVGLDQTQFHELPALKLLLAPLGWGVRPDAELLDAVWLAGVVGGCLALVGLFTRASLFVLAAASTVLVSHAYSYGEQHHAEALMTIALWTLALAPSGAVWSLDALRTQMRHAVADRRFKPGADPPLSPHARWPLRLVQWLLVLAYLSAGTAKLANGGLDWLNGHTLAYYVADDALERGSALGVWMASHVRLLQMMSVGALVVELGFGGIMVWPRLVWVFVLAGVGLHAGIYLLQRAPFPQLVALYTVFVEELRTGALPWRRSTGQRTPPDPTRWTVEYDPHSARALRTMVVLDSLDVRRRLAFRAGAAGGWQVVSPDGRTNRGGAAISPVARAIFGLRPG